MLDCEIDLHIKLGLACLYMPRLVVDLNLNLLKPAR